MREAGVWTPYFSFEQLPMSLCDDVLTTRSIVWNVPSEQERNQDFVKYGTLTALARYCETDAALRTHSKSKVHKRVPRDSRGISLTLA